MAWVRILVDGFSLLHGWPELAPGNPRHSAVAREELIHRLTRYHDACETPITIVFDAAGSKRDADETPSTSGVEILYSRDGQTADQIIERAAYRLKSYGDVLVVTDDLAERETVTSFGCLTSSCENFVQQVETDLADLHRQLEALNLRERKQFGSARGL